MSHDRPIFVCITWFSNHDVQSSEKSTCQKGNDERVGELARIRLVMLGKTVIGMCST